MQHVVFLGSGRCELDVAAAVRLVQRMDLEMLAKSGPVLMAHFHTMVNPHSLQMRLEAGFKNF